MNPQTSSKADKPAIKPYTTPNQRDTYRNPDNPFLTFNQRNIYALNLKQLILYITKTHEHLQSSIKLV